MDEKELADFKKEKKNSFLAKNSSWFGEVLLRFAGSFSMAFPVTKWGAGLRELARGNVAGAFNEAKTDNTAYLTSGLMMLMGKVMGIFSKVRDTLAPANTYLGKVREDFLWPASSGVEAAATLIVFNESLKKKVRHADGSFTQDIAGPIGQVFNGLAYPVRGILPFGKIHLDKDELIARFLDHADLIPEQERDAAFVRSAVKIDEQMQKESPGLIAILSNMKDKYERFRGSKTVSVEPLVVVERSIAKEMPEIASHLEIQHPVTSLGATQKSFEQDKTIGVVQSRRFNPNVQQLSPA